MNQNMYNSNLSDSILFLSSAREALKRTIDVSEMLKIDKVESSNFIMNEASDYEIMSLLMNEELPTQKYNLEEEYSLFDQLKLMVVENYSYLNESIEAQDLFSIINEVNSVTELGYSSAVPVLEFLMHENAAEAAWNAEVAAKKALAAAVASGNKSRIQVAKKALAAATKYLAKVTAATGRGVATGAAATGRGVAAAGEFAGRGAAAGAKAAGRGAAAAGKFAGRGAAAAGKGIGRGAAAAGKFAVRGAAAGAKAAGSGAVTAGKFTVKHKTNIGVAALVAATIYAGYKTFQRYFSQAARACAGKKGDERAMCVKGFKAKAIQAQMATIRQGMSSCANSKNPEKCKQTINSKLVSLQAKLAKSR